MIARFGAGALDTAVRRFATQAAKPSMIQQILFDTPSQNTLAEEFPGVPAPAKGIVAPAGNVQVSKLANGVTVVSKDQGGATASIGLYVKAGSRYETVAGTANVLEHMAFATTQKRSGIKLLRDAEDAGATIASRATREAFVYSGEVLRNNADTLTNILTEAATAPKLWYWEVNEGREAFSELVAANASNPVTALVEGVHAAAFGTDSALGHSLYATPAGLNDVSADSLRAFLGATFTPGNMTVSGVNVAHGALVDMADKYLAALPPAQGAVKTAKPVYTGGESMIRTAKAGAAHVALAFPAPALSSGKALHALGVLQALLGGSGPHGGAAGQASLGPAKQSRVARSLHNESHSFIRSISAFAFPYTDAGLVGLAGSCADHEAGRLVNAMVGFFKDAAAVPATAAELERAKKSYMLSLASETESRAGGRDDMGYSTLLTGVTPSLVEAMKAIEGITAADVQAVAKAALAAPPAVSAIGTLTNVPRYDQVASMLK